MSCLRSSNACRLMRHLSTAMLVSLLLTGHVMAQNSASETTFTLRWLNGDELAGRIKGATQSHLFWQSEALSQALSVDLRTLDVIQVRQDNAETELSSPFQVTLINGDVWAGDLKAINAEHVVLTSARHGEQVIDRQWIDRLIRTDHTAPIDLTGTKGRGWSSVSPSWEHQNLDRFNWKTDVPGEVSTTSPGARLFYSAKLPEFCDVELLIKSSKRPSFSLALGTLSKLKARTGNLEFETWGDELVVQADSAAAEFTPLMRFRPETRRLRLRAFWDRRAGKLTVYDGSGGVLADVTLNPTDEELDGGVLLENKGTDLTVKMLRISPWNGKDPATIHEANQAQAESLQRVRTVDGNEYAGRISGPDDEGQWVIEPFGEPEVRIDLDQLAEVLSPRAATVDPAVEACELKYFDGTTLHGKLLSIENGTVTLEVPFSEEPLRADLSGLRTLTFASRQTEEAPASDHVLEYQGLTLHGTLAPAKTKLGWRLVGAEEVIPLELDRPLRIRRVNVITDDESSSTEHAGVVYLANGDQLPCRVESVEDGFVTLATEFSPLTKIPSRDVKAVEFGAARPDEIVGFVHRKWNVANNQAKAIERSDDEIIFRGNGSVTHPDLLASGYCEFTAIWPQTAGAYLMLTLQQEQRNPFVAGNQQLCMVYIMHSNNQIMAHIRSGNAGHQATIPAHKQGNHIVDVKIQRDGDRLVLFANGQEAGTLANLDESTRVSGLTISCQQINRANRGKAANKAGKSEPLLSLSKMRAGRVTGLFASLQIGATSRKHALTVPRSRRHNPPKHLLISQTGDLLRGELLALEPTSVQFRAGFDDVTIPRDRLSGIVWLAEPTNEAAEGGRVRSEADGPARATSPTDGQVQAVFPNGVILHLNVEQVDGHELVGTHDVFGECRLSLDKVNELRTGAVKAEMQQVAFSDWTLVPAREPVIPDPNADPSFGTFSTLIGEQAEDFTLELLDGDVFQLSEHQGKVIVLDFWATWCGPCIRSIPQLLETTSAYSPDDVLFVGVNHQENAALVRRVLKDHDWDFTVALDRDGEISRKYLVEGFPQTVIIGPTGRIEHVHLGASSNLSGKLTEIIDSLLSDPDTGSE